MKIIKSISLALLLTPFSLQAATIDAWLVPQNSGPFEINDTFNVEIHASWDDLLQSGGFDLFYEPSVIQVESQVMNVDSYPAALGVEQVGKLDNIGFSRTMAWMAGQPTVYDPTSDIKIATITFKAIGGGISDLILLDSGDDELNGHASTYPWFAMVAGDLDYHDPVFGDGSIGSVTVNPVPNPVPLPAAAWFMLSGLGFLAFRRKRSV